MSDNPWDIASFDFPLTPLSVVMELGGYKGRWCGEIARRYNPRLYVYEPQQWAFDICKAALMPYPNATVFNYGLGIEDTVLPMGEFGTDGCTFLSAGREQGVGVMREWYDHLEQQHIEHIDLLLLNIEGYEYTLLPYIAPMLRDIDYVMVQFHMRYDEGGHRYAAIRDDIARTHRVHFDYGPTLVCWRRL